MNLYEDVKYIHNHLDQTESIEQLRDLLAKKGLEFIVFIVSNTCTCLEWDITHKQLCKILDLGLRIKISRISNQKECFETVEDVSVRIKDPSWVNTDELFYLLKVGIMNCIQMILIDKNVK